MGRTKRTSNCLRYTAKLLRHVETHESSGSYSGFCLLQQLMGKMKCHKACIRCGCLLNLAYFVFRIFQNIVVLWFLLRGGRCMQQRYVALCYLDVMALLCVEAKGSCSRESWGGRCCPAYFSKLRAHTRTKPDAMLYLAELLASLGQTRFWIFRSACRMPWNKKPASAKPTSSNPQKAKVSLFGKKPVLLRSMLWPTRQNITSISLERGWTR